MDAQEIAFEADGTNARGQVRRNSGRFQAVQQAVVQNVREAQGDCCNTCTNCCDLEGRANHKRKTVFHRASALGFWFSILVLAIAFAVGAYFKRVKSNDYKFATADVTIDSVDDLDYNDMLYWITFCTWSGRWHIQAILNFTRGRTLGLSVNYVMWSFIGEMCHLIAIEVSRQTGRTVASFDSRAAVIDGKITFFAINGAVAPFIVLLQCWRYDGWYNQKPSALTIATLLMALIFTAIYMLVNLALIGDSVGSTMAITRWIYGCEIFAIMCSVYCYIPQYLLSKRFKVAIGVDMLHLFFQLFGACSLFCLIFFQTLKENNFRIDTFATFRDVITVEIRQLVQSVFIVILVIILLAQIIIYWKMPTKEEVLRGIEESKKDMNNSARDERVHRRAAAKATAAGGRGGGWGRGPLGLVARRNSGQGQGQGQGYTNVATTQPVAAAPSTPQQQQQGRRPTSLTNPNPASAPAPASGSGSPRTPGRPNTGNSSASPAATPGTPTVAIPRWKCSVCTFSNEAGNIYCLMCETAMDHDAAAVMMPTAISGSGHGR